VKGAVEVDAEAVTGIESRSDVACPGWSPSERSTASTAATSDSEGPKRRPNWPGRRKWWKFAECRSDKDAMKEVTADGLAVSA